MKFKFFICIFICSLVLGSCHLRRKTKPSVAISKERIKVDKKSKRDAKREIRKRKRKQRRTGYYGG